ncbi:hypothetical protein O9929_21165 [Vibrio lentus]|nr:hypothetical protein [Vibrio lentus]
MASVHFMIAMVWQCLAVALNSAKNLLKQRDASAEVDGRCDGHGAGGAWR